MTKETKKPTKKTIKKKPVNKKTISTKINEMGLSVVSKRVILTGMFAIGGIVAVGWVMGSIITADALLVILPLYTGGFSLLQGK